MGCVRLLNRCIGFAHSWALADVVYSGRTGTDRGLFYRVGPFALYGGTYDRLVYGAGFGRFWGNCGGGRMVLAVHVSSGLGLWAWSMPWCSCCCCARKRVKTVPVKDKGRAAGGESVWRTFAMIFSNGAFWVILFCVRIVVFAGVGTKTGFPRCLAAALGCRIGVGGRPAGHDHYCPTLSSFCGRDGGWPAERPLGAP